MAIMSRKALFVSEFISWETKIEEEPRAVALKLAYGQRDKDAGK